MASGLPRKADAGVANFVEGPDAKAACAPQQARKYNGYSLAHRGHRRTRRQAAPADGPLGGALRGSVPGVKIELLLYTDWVNQLSIGKHKAPLVIHCVRDTSHFDFSR
jgi:hypothetical protein